MMRLATYNDKVIMNMIKLDLAGYVLAWGRIGNNNK